jgi:hypothetical protein
MKNYRKQVLMVYLTMVAAVCFAQTKTAITKDSLKLFVRPFSIYSFNEDNYNYYKLSIDKTNTENLNTILNIHRVYEFDESKINPIVSSEISRKSEEQEKSKPLILDENGDKNGYWKFMQEYYLEHPTLPIPEMIIRGMRHN